VPGKPDLDDDIDCEIFVRDPTLPVRIHHRLVTTKSEPLCPLADEDVLGGADVGPQPVGHAIHVERVPVASGHMIKIARDAD
jgi:hypothetical protein